MLRSKVVTIIFICCLCMPLINMFFRIIPDDPVTDNRKLAVYPAYGTKLKNFYMEFQNYFHDNFAFRNKLIGLNGNIHYSLLKTSTSERVIIGKKGWLYFTDEGIMDDFHGKIKVNDIDMTNALNFFVDLQNQIEARSEGRTKFILAVCPNPQSIYPEYLPEHEKYTFGNKSRLDQYIDYFTQNNGVKILDLRPALLKAKESSQEWLYFSNDSHWNRLGAEVAFKEIINRINDEGIPVQIPHYSIDRVTTWSGDLARVISAKSVPKSFLHNFAFDDVSVRAYNNWADASYEQSSTVSNGLSIVVFGDSYSDNLRTLVGGTFAHSYFEQLSIYEKEIVENVNRVLLAYEPDIIVFEYVERRLYLFSLLSFVNKFAIGKPFYFYSGISYNDYSNSNGMYIKSGISVENDHAWSTDKTAEMALFFENVESDLFFGADVDILGDAQEVQLYVNDQFVDSVTLMKSQIKHQFEDLHFFIRKDCLVNGLNDFKFVFPQAASPVELGIGRDERKLAVCFYSFVVGLFDAPVINDDFFN